MYTSDTLKIGPVSSGDRAAIRTLTESLAVTAVDDGDYIIVGPMDNNVRTTVSNKALALGLGCEDYTVTQPENPESPAVDLTEVKAALARIEEAMASAAAAQTAQNKKLDDMLSGISLLSDKLAAAGAALK